MDPDLLQTCFNNQSALEQLTERFNQSVANVDPAFRDVSVKTKEQIKKKIENVRTKKE